jgi:hypothetical protein
MGEIDILIETAASSLPRQTDRETFFSSDPDLSRMNFFRPSLMGAVRQVKLDCKSPLDFATPNAYLL